MTQLKSINLIIRLGKRALICSKSKLNYDKIIVTADVTNTGDYDGIQVVKVYVGFDLIDAQSNKRDYINRS